MELTDLHGPLLANAFCEVLGQPEQGAMAFARCLTEDVVEALSSDVSFSPQGWQVLRVADAEEGASRSVTADRAVELRESKGAAVLLLVDTGRAGAGMDGIYSAAREVNESDLFRLGRRIAGSEITRRLSRSTRDHSERAIRTARGYGRRLSISPWTEFDFLVRVAAAKQHPGELLYLLGLWPVLEGDGAAWETGLELSRLFVERLLGTVAAGLTPAQRIEALKLLDPSREQLDDLERFLRSAATKPSLAALTDLAEQKHLWVNALRVEGTAQVISAIELQPWRTDRGRIVAWSGLHESHGSDQQPVLTLHPDAAKTGSYSKLEVRWRARPDNLEKRAVEYRVAILTDMEEELSAREVPHSGKSDERCRFTNDDFAVLSDDSLISAKVVVAVVGNDQVEKQESEEFLIRFGEPPDLLPGGVGKKFRALSEGLIELSDRESVSDLVSSSASFSEDSKGFVLLRAGDKGKSFRVFRPALIREVEQQWIGHGGAIGRWRAKVRASGARVGKPEFLPFDRLDSMSATPNAAHLDRVASASRRMAERFEAVGGVGQVYDDRSKAFESVVKEYLLAWAALLESGHFSLALANTVEVQSLSGRTIGLVVLPSHPSRVAWHVAYDNLVLNAAFEQSATPKEIREEFRALDGALFPAFLPGIQDGSTFVFADTLGFHAVGMVADQDREPKAAVAILARALGEGASADTVPTVGEQSAEVLGREILKYLDCHDAPKLLQVHALRPGDGLTIARSLGRVREALSQARTEEELDEGEQIQSPAFVLELYPSPEQQGFAGRFIAEAREKRRRGAGVLAPEDHWMLDSLSLPGGVNLPRLRWARKIDQEPSTPAHVAVAFDTFESRVVQDQSVSHFIPRPLFAYGLISFLDRKYTDSPSPLWRSSVLASTDGEKHPSDRTHSERLVRIQQVLQNCVARSLASNDLPPVLRTEISPAKADSLRELHRLCDWVITLDRNAGIEYFDSPLGNRETYDAYVIDCVPEREDLGCLQLITSTCNLDEVRNLLDGALDQMGLSRSRRNAEFLMGHLKALSGRLAIRLTGQKAPTSELIALALCHANCRQAPQDSTCWTALKTGFLIPVDDVLDMLPPLSTKDDEVESSEARPDLIYVTVVPRKGLAIQFVEVKYRRHLRAARGPDLLESVRRQVGSLRARWDEWYGLEGVAPSFRATRRAKLARVFRFYADKAHRHHLPREQYETLALEIDRMIEKGGEYSFAVLEKPDRGWVFCPEFGGANALEISPTDWDVRVFLFGPGLLPHSHLQEESHPPQAESGEVHATQGPVSNAQSPARDSELPEALATEGTAALPKGTAALSECTNAMEIDGQAPRARPGELEPAILLGRDQLTGGELRWSLTVKGNPHLLVAGLPGMGKTTLLLNVCQQMLEAGVRPIVFSYHQDMEERLEQLVGTPRFVDYRGLGFNPLQVIDRQSRTAYLDVAGALRDIFVAIYPELGDIQGERIRKAIKQSFIESGWDNPTADLTVLEEPLFARFVEILASDPKPDRGLRSLLGRLEELADYGFFDLAEKQESLWSSDQAILIRIHSTQNDNLQKAFASLVFYGLYKDMFRRGTQDRITHAVIFDEAHRAAKLRLIPTMAKECRKFGISLVLASQEAKDFNVSLFSAIANYLVLRLNEADAKALVRNVASSDLERSLIDKIKQMERFRGLYFSEGRRKPCSVLLRP